MTKSAANQATAPAPEDSTLAAFLDSSREGRRLFAEGWGTFLLVLVACGAAMTAERTGALGPAAAAAAPGLTVMVAIYVLGAVGGAHLNPAVTLAFALRGNFPWSRAPGYVLAQFAGALCAVLLLRTAIGDVADLGATKPGPGTNGASALAVEIVLTAGLVNTILATASGARNVGANAAIAVGAWIVVAGLWAAPISGASMNPARSLAPDLVRGDLSTAAIYLVGPLVGALVGVAIEWILKGPPSREGSRAAQGEDRG